MQIVSRYAKTWYAKIRYAKTRYAKYGMQIVPTLKMCFKHFSIASLGY